MVHNWNAKGEIYLRRLLNLGTGLAAILLLIALRPALAQTVTGTVATPQGVSLSGARVTLFDADTTFFREVRAGADGTFRIEDVSPGRYTVGASLPTYEYREQVIDVSGGESRLDFVLGPDTHPGRWEMLGELEEPFGGTNSGVLLPNGRILYCHDTLDSVIFDPVTNGVVLPPHSPRIQGCHAVTMLPDGRVIYVGGADQPIYGPGTRQVKTFDPLTLSWEVQPDLTDSRWYPTMVPLPDGELLAVGGGGLDNPVRIRTSEVFDPASMTWRRVGDVEIGNEVSPVALLYTGEVLMTHRPPQLYNPDTQQWRRAADFVQGNRMPDGDHSDHEIVLVPDGKVVAIGYKSFTPGNPGNLVEIYDPISDTWQLGANRAPVRSRASLVLLPDKRILVLGGFKEQQDDPTPTNAWGYMKLAETYDPASDTWRRMADLNIAREYHAMPVLVPDGRVVVTGGEGQPGVEPEESIVEIFSPPYLFRGVRPELSTLAQTAFQRGGRIPFRVTRTAAPTRIVLMGTSANTHFMESGNARYLELPFEQDGEEVVAQLPADPIRLPLGFYILFAMVGDIPSVGQIVQIEPGTSVGVEVPEEKPGSPYSLQVYPNPFVRTTTVTFSLPRFEPVTVKVFNALGAEVGTLLSDRLKVGSQTAVWNAQGLPNGVYFIRLETRNSVQSKAVILMK